MQRDITARSADRPQRTSGRQDRTVTASIDIETQCEHQYVVRLRDGEDHCVSWFHINPALLEEVDAGGGGEERLVRRTAEYLVARQSVSDFPTIVELEDVIAAYDDYVDAMTRR